LRTFKILLKQAELSAIRFHDLRHTSASLMLNHDIPVIVVSRRLGHASASITSDIYNHLLPSIQDGAVEIIDELVTPTEVKFENPVPVG
jgi:integrase